MVRLAKALEEQWTYVHVRHLWRHWNEHRFKENTPASCGCIGGIKKKSEYEGLYRGLAHILHFYRSFLFYYFIDIIVLTLKRNDRGQVYNNNNNLGLSCFWPRFRPCSECLGSSTIRIAFSINVTN